MDLFDTHTHLDFDDFATDRLEVARVARQSGIKALLVTGVTAKHFNRLLQVQQQLNADSGAPKCFIAPGLHPMFIDTHQAKDLSFVDQFISNNQCVAIGEIGIDTFTQAMKKPEAKKLQHYYFASQLDMAKSKCLPVILHVRKSHAQVIAMIKSTGFGAGGIAHGFSGGEQEAFALIDLGFKIGITGQITNRNAKKLHRVVRALGPENLVMETDCPDMLPHAVRKRHDNSNQEPIQCSNDLRNEPANLTYVLSRLADIYGQPQDVLAKILWQNSCESLGLSYLLDH